MPVIGGDGVDLVSKLSRERGDQHAFHCGDMASTMGVNSLKAQRPTFWLILLVSLALAGAGIALDEPRQVFRNAVVICLSCIGIQ